ncbi:hypothetical protein QBC39DRAFT_35087 [Podospora conica]|nr:hypothetical protein QBC39DRAFT_35087 [Schizothecium conicum]
MSTNVLSVMCLSVWRRGTSSSCAMVARPFSDGGVTCKQLECNRLSGRNCTTTTILPTSTTIIETPPASSHHQTRNLSNFLPKTCLSPHTQSASQSLTRRMMTPPQITTVPEWKPPSEVVDALLHRKRASQRNVATARVWAWK